MHPVYNIHMYTHTYITRKHIRIFADIFDIIPDTKKKIMDYSYFISSRLFGYFVNSAYSLHAQSVLPVDI